jgi:3'(2'), 5'-bisphosphate nucleotidase
MVHLPLEDTSYAAAGGIAWRQRDETAGERIAARRPLPGGLVVVHSRSHANSPKLAAWLADHEVAERLHAGSAAKFCLVAAGAADLYPRLGPTSEWDTAAGQAIVEAAGGRVSTLEGERLAYGKPRFLNDSFVVRGRE